ncbi:MAG TPA: NAD-dependent epimerase/dehydratase family protein [Acidimicrobiales bacterium]|nr:NAD-dependent epimerase/dehydratase family protein [Acidimicrobiales bacterium]
MPVVVTGAAGFIGSHLCQALLATGEDVLGIDCFTGYYERAAKERNLAALLAEERFCFVEDDLRSADLAPLLDGVDVVYHQAGQPGVRPSWAAGFPDYVSHNVLATQRLLEAARLVGCPRLVAASSSSVYGESPRWPSSESDLPAPHSPYGVTKLAAEHLCSLYAANWGLSTVSLRYFTVYGPRQRPDMAIGRLVASALEGTSFTLLGDGSQIRDFTYVGDVVAANLAAAAADVAPGTVCNVAGGSSITLGELVGLVERLAGRPVALVRRPAQPGDVSRTGGSVDRAERLLGWSPSTSLESGLLAHLAWAGAELAAETARRAPVGAA